MIRKRQNTRISFTAIAAEIGISPASTPIYQILTNSLGKRSAKWWKCGMWCTKWIAHILTDDQKVMHVLITTTHLQGWKN